jgi:hypothetical protein
LANFYSVNKTRGSMLIALLCMIYYALLVSF